MSIREQVAIQLSDDLGGRIHDWIAVVGPDMAHELAARVDVRVQALAGEMCSEDDRIAAEAVLTVMSVLWPDSIQPPVEWWRTPVGRMVARSIGADDSDAVTRTVAAAMLGVHPGTVAQMTHRGTLDRHPDGGITRASVLARLARTSTKDY